jgi:PAT family beta-lactamase induction signal transducer AmpG
MPSSPGGFGHSPSPTWRAQAASLHRLLVITLLGFASGLPLALTGQAMQAWLTIEGLDLAAIGFLSLVGLPYTFKFLWAPLLDRFDLPLLGRRRGWLVLTQLAMALVLLALAATSPKDTIRLFALLAVCVAFVSATQDVIIDAYRTDLLPAPERGLGASLYVMGYRLAMILSGGIALIWTDPGQAGGPGGGWTWPEVYRFMALLMGGAAVLSLFVLPPLPPVPPAPAADQGTGAPGSLKPAKSTHTGPSNAVNDLRGFAAVLAAVAVGVWLSDRFGPPLAQALLGPLLQGGSLPEALQKRWLDLAALLAGIAFTLPLAAWAARLARFDTLLGGLQNYFSQRGAAAFLLFIVLYKLGDAFAGSLMTPFLLKSMAYSSAEVGVVNKVLGLWMTIGGALLGGLLMIKLGLWRSLMFFGLLQLLSNLGFWWLAVSGKGVLPGTTLPAFDWGFVKLATPTPVDGGLLMVVAFENISGGMGTAAFVAFLMSLCNRRFTATQFALLSAFASVGRVWVGPLAGVLAQTIGWPTFFIISTVLAAPALLMLWGLRGAMQGLEEGAQAVPDSAAAGKP